MTIGPGKYDDICTTVRERTNAQAVALIVLDGDKGNGFSVQSSAAVLKILPDILESMARQIRSDA